MSSGEVTTTRIFRQDLDRLNRVGLILGATSAKGERMTQAETIRYLLNVFSELRSKASNERSTSSTETQ